MATSEKLETVDNQRGQVRAWWPATAIFYNCFGWV